MEHQQQETSQNRLKSIKVRSNSPDSSCCENFAIFLNLLVLLFLFLFVFSYLKSQNDDKDGGLIYYGIFGILVYIIYFISEYCSSTYTYLSSIKYGKINEIMDNIYRSQSSLILSGTTYHKKVEFIGGRHTETTVINDIENARFNVISCRDVSGTFNLNINKSKCNCKYYLILKVILEIHFDNSQTLRDYNNFRNGLLSRLRTRDKYHSISENIDTSIKDVYFIKFKGKGKEFCLIGLGWFTLFTFFGLGIIYRIYIRIITIDETVIIKKLISTNVNLYNERAYNKFNPILKFQNQTFTYIKNNNISERESINSNTNNEMLNINYNINNNQSNEMGNRNNNINTHNNDDDISSSERAANMPSN